ncbi:MAG: hypothetical protein MI924_15045 [Chloroflexales bacterium]|nr:hypothetical protein [Chloroflexales bacterium]
MEEIRFSRGPARRPVARPGDSLLQWSTGLQTDKRTIYAGWLVETGRSETLDEAMETAGFTTVTIRHGSGNTVMHWAVEQANLFVIAEGVQGITEMKNTPDRYGVAFGWRTLPDGRPQSALKFRALLHELLDVDYTEPLLVSVKSTLTGDLLAALMHQYDVLDAIDRERAAKGQPPLNPPFYACSIPLGPGAEVARGSAQKKEIVPIVAHVPDSIDRSYLVAHYIRKPWVTLIEGMLDATITWSVTASQQITMGEDLATQSYGDEPYPEPINQNGDGRYVAESSL